MFQNISDIKNEQNNTENNNTLYRLKEIFRIQNIAIYVLTFLMSTLSIKGQIMPFGLAMIAACVGETVPLIGVIISAIIGTVVGGGVSNLLSMLINLAVYLFLVLFIKSKVAVEERNEEIKSGGKLFAACFLVPLIKNIIGEFILYDVFMSLIAAALTYVFYKIFVNGLASIKDFRIKEVFTVEELIASAIIIAIASLALNNITIFSMKISNIIIILMIMILGWQKGIRIGAVSGISIGIATCFVDGTSLTQVLVFAFSGAFSGVLNKFGKIGVIVGFILGNVILTYLIKETSMMTIYLREIFVASIGLLATPKKFKINVEEIFAKDRYIDNKGENRLEEAKKEAKSERLKTISKMFNNFMDKQDAKVITSTNIEQDFLDSLEEINQNIFYEEISNEENGIARDICAVLVRNNLLLDNDLVEILKNHNSYIFMQDESIKNDLQEIVKIANRTIKVVQTNNIRVQERKRKLGAFNEELEDNVQRTNKDSNDINSKKAQEIENLLKSKNIKINDCSIKQIENKKYIIELKLDYLDKKIREKEKIVAISELLSKTMGIKIAFQREKDDEEKEEYCQVYSSEDKFVLQVASGRITKEGSQVSGDCSLQIKLADGKYLLAIADGKGTGKKAREYSKITLKLIKQLLSSGFNREKSVKLINSRLNMFEENERFSTLDATILDLYEGKIEILKNGACATFIRNKKEIRKIQSETMPLETTTDVEVQAQSEDIGDGEIIVMCSDGVLNSKSDYGIWMEDFIKNISTKNVQKIADLILAEALDNYKGTAKDDMTVIVSKIVKKSGT